MRRCGRLTGSDSCPRIPRLTPPSSKRIGCLYPSRILRQAFYNILSGVMVIVYGNEISTIPLFGSAIRLIRPFRDFSGNRFVGLPGTDRILVNPTALLRAPPRGIPGYSLLSGGRLLTGDRRCALICFPPARLCIYCLSAFPRPVARAGKGTDAEYPPRFSPMRAFRPSHGRKPTPLRTVFIPFMH